MDIKLNKYLVFFIRGFLKCIYFFIDRIEYSTSSIFKKKTTVIYPTKMDSKNKHLALAIFAIYQPNGLGKLIKRSITYLIKSGVRIIIVIPHPLPVENIDYLKTKQCIVILRKNFGRDFGSYQCGFFYLLKHQYLLDSVEKILLINDSIIFPIKENNTSLLEILNLSHDIVGLTESYFYQWHICSYFILFKKEVFFHPDMIKFWKKYRAYSSRFHAIRNGEIALGKLIQRMLPTPNYKIVYDGKTILETLSKEMLCKGFYDLIDLTTMEVIYSKIAILEKLDLEKNLDIKKLSLFIETNSILHTFALALIEYLNCFIIKKDICFRGFFSINYILQYLYSITEDPQFVQELKQEFNFKGLPITMGPLKKILYLTGAF